MIATIIQRHRPFAEPRPWLCVLLSRWIFELVQLIPWEQGRATTLPEIDTTVALCLPRKFDSDLAGTYSRRYSKTSTKSDINVWPELFTLAGEP